jgi:hypothetical protein
MIVNCCTIFFDLFSLYWPSVMNFLGQALYINFLHIKGHLMNMCHN